MPDIPDIQQKTVKNKAKPSNTKPSKQNAIEISPVKILQEIKAYDTRNHKSMVHVRFDESTAQLLNQFKMATNVDVTKLVAFSVQALFQSHPELKSIIKQFIQKFEV